MPEVQNIGAVNSAQYQPSQYPVENYAEDYSMQPEVYDENAAQMRAASKSRLGASLLTGAVIAGLALWGGHAWGKRSAKDAVANYEKAQKALEEIEKTADENAGLFLGKNRIGRSLYNKLKELCKIFKNSAEEGKEKAADDVKEAAEELKDKAAEAK